LLIESVDSTRCGCAPRLPRPRAGKFYRTASCRKPLSRNEYLQLKRTCYGGASGVGFNAAQEVAGTGGIRPKSRFFGRYAVELHWRLK
jgi:hypothetical protein